MATVIVFAISTTATAQSIIDKVASAVNNVSYTADEIEYSVNRAESVVNRTKKAKDAVTGKKGKKRKSADYEEETETVESQAQPQRPAASQEMRIKTDASGQKTWHFGSRLPQGPSPRPLPVPCLMLLPVRFLIALPSERPQRAP